MHEKSFLQEIAPRGSDFFIHSLFFFFADFKLNLHAAEISSATISSIIEEEKPVYIYIPSINLFSKIQGVGVNKKGNMDVPSGKTNNVGWYKHGVTPGETGTAVLDAHNTAAFKKLNALPVGEEIYIYTSSSEWLKFEVTKAKTYPVEKLSPSTLFAQANAPQINLITCAGLLLGNGEASHRLIVSAKLV